jgi:UDP:flavonoid glycosyltransferase YjiC (YdhE family)
MGGRERLRIGCCISGHGFGHATRSIAILQSLSHRLDSALTIVTTAPAELFAESLTVPFVLHTLAVDVGLIQHSALVEDLPATLHALDDLFSHRLEEQVARIAALLAGCQVVLCDIAPLGIAAARQARIPSVLIENFTWDWIYEAYADRWPQLRPHIDTLRDLFRRADHRIQSRPVCSLHVCDLAVDPVARPLRQPERLRQYLYLEPGQHLVLLTMGGLGGEAIPLQALLQRPDLVFVLPGRSRENEFSGNLRLLGREASWYQPDLVAAADLVVGKLGYSTVAEAYQAGTPFAYVPRRDFPESPILAAFVDRHLPSWRIDPEAWRGGQWLAALPRFPLGHVRTPRTANGAEQAADWLADLLAKEVHASS